MGAGMEVGSSEAEQSAPVSPSLTSFLPTARPTHCSPKTQVITANVPRSDPGTVALEFHHLRFQNLSGFPQHSTHPNSMKSGLELSYSCADLRVPAALPVSIWKLLFFSSACVDLSTLMGLVCFLLFASQELQASCSCRLAPLEISKTAVTYSATGVKTQQLAKTEIKLSLPH